MTEERAPDFLGNLSVYPNGIYGYVDEIDQYAVESLNNPSNIMPSSIFETLDENEQFPSQVFNNDRQYAAEEIEQYDFNVDFTFLDDLENTNEISEDIIKELNDLEKDCIPKSTQTQMQTHFERFRQFLRDKKLNEDLSSIHPSLLDKYLRYFYSTLRKGNGEYYSPARAALHRYFCLIRSDINIIADFKFNQSNRMLKTMVALFKKSGQYKVEEKYPAIQQNDMEKIRGYFDRSSFEILQIEIIFNFIYFFGLRGRETLPHLTVNSIDINTSSSGKRYLRINPELLSKNAKSSMRQNEYEDLKKARAYENLDNPSECAVLAWEKYHSHVSQFGQLFPKPTKMTSKKSTELFSKRMCLGKHYIDNIMKNLSQKLNLSRIYTNHCIRVTVTVLKEGGFSNSDIALFTGHKNPASVERYARKRRDEDYENIAEVAQAGTSKSLVTIQKVSKKSRIIVNNDSLPYQEDSGVSSSVNFNGTFNNCDIKVLK